MNDKAVFNERTAVCRIIDTLPNSGAILKSRFWSCHDYGDTSKHRYEVERYMDYCSVGTLSSIIENSSAERWQEDTDDQIPEPKFWIVLITISEAIYNLTSGLMYTLDLDDTAEAMGWIPKVHRHIKPSNIFLMEPQEPFSSFPRPVLADLDDMLELFGYEEYTKKYPDAQGFGYFHRQPLSCKTDVWSLGTVPWEMMHTFLGPRKAQGPWHAAITNTSHRDPAQSHFHMLTLPVLAPTMDEPAYIRDLIRIFELRNQSMPAMRPTAVGLRRLVERKMRKA